MAKEEKKNTDIDDWLKDQDEDEIATRELDQSFLDNLLDGAEEIGEELDQADIDKLLGDSDLEHPDRESPSAKEGTIDKAEMDKLFSNTGDEALPGEDVDFVEIQNGQGDMVLPLPAQGEDGFFWAGSIPQVWKSPRPFIGLGTPVLFSGWSHFVVEEEKINTDVDDWLKDQDEDEIAARELDRSFLDNLQGGAEEIGEELDQADIDNLLGDSDLEHPDRESPSAKEGTIDKAEMDKLFSNTGDEALPGEDVDFVEIQSGQGDMVLPLPDLGEDGTFDAAFFMEPAVDEKMVFQSQPFPVEQAIQTSVATKGKELSPFGGKELVSAADPGRRPFYRSRSFQTLFVVLLVFLLGSGTYFLFSSIEQPAIVLKGSGNDGRMTAEAVPVQTPDRKPEEADNLGHISPDGGEVTIKKQRTDQDGIPSNYQVEEQTYGRVSVEKPNLVYLLNDDLPDRESFSNQVQDDKNPGNGEKAVLHIHRPDLAKEAFSPGEGDKGILHISGPDLAKEAFFSSRKKEEWLQNNRL